MTAKNPITVERLKTFVLCGHSNADGWVGTEDMFALFPHLLPGTAAPLTYPQNAWYKNVYVFTNDHPWALTLGTPQYLTTPGQGEWLELAVGYPASTSDPFPHASPYVYPNNAGAIYAHWLYKGYDSAALDGANGVRCGVEIPLQWYWRNHWGEQVGFVKLAFGSSYFLPAEQGNAAVNWFNYAFAPFSPSSAEFLPGTVDTNQFDSLAWWTPADQFDFAPTTGRFFQSLLDKLAGAQAALPEGTKMDVQLIVPWMGDNDSLGRTIDGLANFKQFVLMFVDKLRQACVDNDWTTLPKEQIPIVWPGIHYTYDNTANSPISTDTYLNGLLQEIADDDPYFAWISSDDFTTMYEEGQLCAIDTTNHIGASGYRTAAEDIYEAWLAMQTDPFDAIAVEDRVTLSEVKSRVRTYYNRARVSTDIDDDTVLIHINGALNSILNSIGDNAYWLRKREDMSLTIGFGAVTTMPRYVSRVLKIEDAVDPRYPLKFTQIGFGDGGKLQIQLDERGTSRESSSGAASYIVNYITRPRDLSRDDQLVPLPRTIIEWLVVDTCRRLARSGSNIPLQASMEGESRELRDRCLKELQVMQRAKKDRLHTVRKFPTLRYRRG